ncbi:MAG: S-layer homology domain-containing protein [Cyanobacteria bacterium P01_F01_bin.150]
MTNQTPPNSRPPIDERQDELIAVLIALGAIGAIFFWGFGRTNDAKLATQLEENPIAAAVDGEQDGFLTTSGDNDNESGFLSALNLAGGDGDDELTDAASSDDTTVGSPNNSNIGIAGAAVGGSALVNSASAEAAESDTSELEGGDTSDTDTDGLSEVNDEQEETLASDQLDSSTDNTDAADADAADADAADADDVGEVELSDLATDVPTEEFSDIEQDYWASPFIEGLRENNVVTGFVGGKFAPDSPVSRSQFAAQLYRADQKYDTFAQDSNAAALVYSDIPPSHPQADAISQVAKTGFMSGYPEGDFRPNDRVSKLEVLIALASGLNLDVPANPDEVLRNSYGDSSDVPDWAVPKIAAATAAGLVVNYDDVRSLSSSKPATRAEASAMLYQALVSLDEAPAIDSEYIVGGN